MHFIKKKLLIYLVNSKTFRTFVLEMRDKPTHLPPLKGEWVTSRPMTLDKFKEAFEELGNNEKIELFNSYCREYGDGDEEFFSFDEEFFNIFFSDPMEAARATFFGHINNWQDEYIRFNAYGNLESFDEYSAVDEISDYHIEGIFEHTDLWKDYIDDDDDDDEEEEGVSVCPHCGHVFVQGEWNFNYDTALLDFECPECGWEGNATQVGWEPQEE